MRYSQTTPEQHVKHTQAQTPEEILAFVAEEGYELTDEELDGISGGWGVKETVQKALQCPNCNGYEVYRFPQPGVPGIIQCACKSCGLQWTKALGILDSYNP